MNKHELYNLIKTIIVGAKLAVAAEDAARAHWLSVCREELPESANTSNVVSLIKDAVKRGAHHVEYDAALGALHTAIAEKERFIEPLFKMLAAFDEVSSVAERIEMLGIHMDHAKNADESYTSLWMIASRLEQSSASIEQSKRDPFTVGECGALYSVIGWHVREHDDGEARALEILRAATPIPGIEKYGVHEGQLVRAWSPWVLFSEDECADA